jgi:hypothetical protein
MKPYFKKNPGKQQEIFLLGRCLCACFQDDFPVIWLHEASQNVPGLAWVHRVGARHVPGAQEHVQWHHRKEKRWTVATHFSRFLFIGKKK